MQVQVAGCRQLIGSCVDKLTKKEKKVALYVLENFDDVINQNIMELAENSEVSDASVVRFCKSLGFKGFQDFKINMARDVLTKEQTYNPALSPTDGVQDVCRKIFQSGEMALQNTLAVVDTEKVADAVELISKANGIYMFGTGGSSMVAADAGHKFMKIGKLVYAYSDLDQQLMSASLMQPDDVGVFISHSGNNINIVNCMKVAKKQGAKVISISGQGRSQVSRIADISLQVAAEKTMFQSEAISARLAQLALLDSLVALVGFRNYDESYEAIQKTREATTINKY